MRSWQYCKCVILHCNGIGYNRMYFNLQFWFSDGHESSTGSLVTIATRRHAAVGADPALYCFSPFVAEVSFEPYIDTFVLFVNHNWRAATSEQLLAQLQTGQDTKRRLCRNAAASNRLLLDTDRVNRLHKCAFKRSKSWESGHSVYRRIPQGKFSW